jgi:hypothetical protein
MQALCLSVSRARENARAVTGASSYQKVSPFNTSGKDFTLFCKIRIQTKAQVAVLSECLVCHAVEALEIFAENKRDGGFHNLGFLVHRGLPNPVISPSKATLQGPKLMAVVVHRQPNGVPLGERVSQGRRWRRHP